MISQHEKFTQLCLPNCFYQNKTYIQSNDNKNRHIHVIGWITQKMKKYIMQSYTYKKHHKTIIIFFISKNKLNLNKNKKLFIDELK